MPEENPNELRIISKPPAFAIDGNSISIHPTGQVDVAFFQIHQKIDAVLEANVVANVRMNMEQLLQLQRTIDEVIEAHEKKMAEGKKQ